MTQPKQDIVEQLLQVGLISDSEVTRIDGHFEDSNGGFDRHAIVQEMLSGGRLTPFQAREVEAGRGRQLLLGNYLLLSKLGQGGMGTVYKALHTRMQRVVALKTLKPGTSSPMFIERFYREVRAAARLNHPHAVAAYDADECELGHFLVMEFVDGEDLSTTIKRGGPLPIAEAITAIRHAAEALSYAHRFGIVHRDIKPANLMRDSEGNVKLADLGLARLQSDSESDIQEKAGLTQAGTSLGTVDYISPEQAMDASSVDGRADIYSLGCTLHYLLIGRPVYEEPTLMARLLAHRNALIPSLCERRSDVPAVLDELFRKMVAKDPNDRMTSMDDVIAALNPFDANSSAEDEVKLSELTVFVVEPSTFQSKVLQSYLNELGIDDVHLFGSVQETLRAITKLRPQVVVTSFQLPDGNGIEFLQRLRDDLRWSLTPVILLTSDPIASNQQQFLRDTRAVALIEKPYKQEQIAEALKRTVSESHEQSTNISGLAALRVLIVDDSSVARRRIEKTMSDIGFNRFTHAEDGRQAANLIAQKTFELIVTDYNMPEMNGYELVAWIRKESSQPHVPIVMCTTEYDPSKLGEVYQLGVSAICNKSFDEELVRNIVIRLFK